MTKGYLAMVLHAHLPFVRHPENEHTLEERWLFEAITETYIPLLNVFEKLRDDGIDYRLTISLSPPLMNMLVDSLLQERYLRYLQKLRELAYLELDRTYDHPAFHPLAQMYQYKINNCIHTFQDKYKGNLLQAFKTLQDQGYLELITCGGTHGYFPLNRVHPQAIKAQVAMAVRTYEENFHRTPKGLWLPECAYHPGDDYILKEYGIDYFFVDAHGILFADKQPRYGIYAPLYCESGVAAFGRDMESSKQVWSAQEGYPGDFDYREYYRDIGYDLDWEYIKPYVHPEGFRINTGLKYYRITGRGDHKEPYMPNWAQEKAALHAGNFLHNRQLQVKYLGSYLDRKPIIVSPYDAELFGHWWYEGPDFLNYLIRKVHCDQSIVKMISPGDYLTEYPKNQVANPSISSWGEGGYHEVWLNESNDWIYRHLHQATKRMISLAHKHPNALGLTERALKQAARELLLAQASDWAFIMKTGTMVDYAIRRTKAHLLNFNELYQALEQGNIDSDKLATLEHTNNIFPNVDYRLYA